MRRTLLSLRQSGLVPDWMASYPRHLVDTGPYGMVRHRPKWCMLGITLATAVSHRNQLAVNLLYTLYLAVTVVFEENRDPRAQAGYIVLSRLVPRLVPSLKPHRVKQAWR
jgi:protein-S-isoprenylcysteine O-methyltransferase Ste14